MLCIQNPNTNPYFNIAAEEYLLKSLSDDIFMLYRNEPSVIIGKHQNAFAEINYWFAKEQGINVIRRLSGGGTVFHDLGNINFTFIQNGREGNLVNFQRFTEPILQTLIEMGVPVTRSSRNDLFINNLKISGNAEHVYKSRVLHHGTLLFASALNELKKALKADKEGYTDKAVKSFRSPTGNISMFLTEQVSIINFMKRIQDSVLSDYNNVNFYQYSEADISAINKLVSEKYATREWNFGYSPRFNLIRSGEISSNAVHINLEVEKGIITKIEMSGNSECVELSRVLLNSPYTEEEILKGLQLVFGNTMDSNVWLKLLL